MYSGSRFTRTTFPCFLYLYACISEPALLHFVTCTVLHWIPVFIRLETVEILLKSLRYLQDEGLNVYAYVILENHLHMVVQSRQLDGDIRRFIEASKKC